MAALHPLLVHFPIALAFLWPVADAIGLATGRSDVSRVAVGLLALAVVSGLVATVTGQAAFDAAVAAKVDPALLNTHADDANLYPWVMLVLLVVRTVGALKLGRMAQVGAISLGVLSWWFVVAVGASGGALVYEHGVGVMVPP